MKYLLLMSLLALTGCATMLDTVANYYDSQDSCQLRNLKPGERQPSYCGAANNRSTTHVRQVTPTRYEIYNKR